MSEFETTGAEHGSEEPGPFTPPGGEAIADHSLEASGGSEIPEISLLRKIFSWENRYAISAVISFLVMAGVLYFNKAKAKGPTLALASRTKVEKNDDAKPPDRPQTGEPSAKSPAPAKDAPPEPAKPESASDAPQVVADVPEASPPPSDSATTEAGRRAGELGKTTSDEKPAPTEPRPTNPQTEGIAKPEGPADSAAPTPEKPAPQPGPPSPSAEAPKDSTPPDAPKESAKPEPKPTEGPRGEPSAKPEIPVQAPVEPTGPEKGAAPKSGAEEIPHAASTERNPPDPDEPARVSPVATDSGPKPKPPAAVEPAPATSELPSSLRVEPTEPEVRTAPKLEPKTIRYAEEPAPEPVSEQGGEWVTIPNRTKPAPGRLHPAEASPVRRASAALDDLAATPAPQAAPADDVEPLEPLVHVVQKRENFWTIAKQYYGSGRFYRALWSANRDQVESIDKLYVGTTLRIPPPERLERSLIDPPAGVAPAAARSDRAGVSYTANSGAERASTRVVAAKGQTTAGIAFEDVPIEQPKPRYQVRKYDTLRSIARDTLGDSRRADEILELNGSKISDPADLRPGLILELPEDARVRRTGS